MKKSLIVLSLLLMFLIIKIYNFVETKKNNLKIKSLSNMITPTQSQFG